MRKILIELTLGDFEEDHYDDSDQTAAEAMMEDCYCNFKRADKYAIALKIFTEFLDSTDGEIRSFGEYCRERKGK